MSEESNIGYNIGLLGAQLAVAREELFYHKTDECSKKIDKISDDLFIILDLLGKVRKEREKQDGDHVNLNHLRDELDRFAEVWEQCAYDYAQIKREDNPFPRGKDFSKVSKKDLEWAETTARNLEQRHQSGVRNEMATYETETMAQKQAMEILAQMAKAVRESSGYYTKQAGKV